MRIGGFQPFSLLDYPGKLSAIIFTQGCNFRCPYCHNPNLVEPHKFLPTIPEEEVFDFLRRRQGKLNAVTITGGEPLLQPDLADMLKELRSLGYLIKIDTNGSFPAKLKMLIEAGLVDYLAMDIKAPPSLYGVITQTDLQVNDILLSIDCIRESMIDFEFRTTVFDKLLTLEDVEQIKLLLKPGDKYYLQECRYRDNLVDFSTEPQTEPAFTLRNKYSDLLKWGSEHSIRISLRTI